MYGKLIVLIFALAFGNIIHAGDTLQVGQKKEIKAAGKTVQCKPHKAAKADCFICDPALRDKGRLWCKEHARYEDRCFLCHPEIKDDKRLYCKEHGLYEDECFLCHPELKKKDKTPTKSATPKKG